MNSNSSSATVQLPASGPLGPGARVGPFRIVAKLGEGGMGVVYHAVQDALDRPVALKVLRPELAADPQFRDRFVRESKAAASVCHQNLVVLFDAGTIDGRPYMAFQFVEGGDLDAKLKSGPFQPADALALIAACADGLQALHEVGLVHRDIKPHNIFLDAKGRPKLGDFGLARQSSGDDRMTVTGVGMGTPAYMAPEQAGGAADLDIRADIHALGGTLYTLLTGRTPFTGDTAWMVASAVMNDPPPDPRTHAPKTPDEIAAIVRRAMAKDRAQRFQTPAELRDACRAAHDRLTGKAAAAAPPASDDGLPRGRELWWLAVVPTLLLPLPYLLGPLLDLNPAQRTPRLDQAAAWGAWIAWSLTAAAVAWAALFARRRPTQAHSIAFGGLVLSAVAIGLSCAPAPFAVVAASAGGTGWQGLAAVIAWACVLGWLGWQGTAWWRRRFTDAISPLRRAIIPCSIALLVSLSAHLMQPRATRDDNLGSLLDLGRRDRASLASTTPAIAIGLTVPVLLILGAAMLIGRRSPPR